MHDYLTFLDTASDHHQTLGNHVYMTETQYSHLPNALVYKHQALDTLLGPCVPNKGTES